MFKDFRSFLSFLLEHSLRTLLFLFICATALIQIAGSSDHIKSLVNQNNAYSRFIPALVADNAKAQQPGSTINFKDPAIQSIFEKSFPASDVQSKTESIIDGTYAWLSKKTPDIQVTIDITKNKQQLAESVSNYAFSRLASLPLCGTSQSNVNPLTIECNPRDYDPIEGQRTYLSELLTSDTFLPKTIFTAADLPKNTTGKSIIQQLSFAPTIYRVLTYSQSLLGLLFLLFSIFYILLNTRRRRGVSSFGSLLISTGSGLVITPVVFSILLPSFTKSLALNNTGSQTQKILDEIMNNVTHHFIVTLISYGLGIFFAGLVIYFGERATRPTTKYGRLAKRAGIATSIERIRSDDPRSISGKLTAKTVPLQTSDNPRKKSSAKETKLAAKYRKLYEKKGL